MKVVKLEAIRGFVAFYVVIHHLILFTPLYSSTPEFLKLLFRFGREAVLIFFLLSGFVICLSMQKNGKDSFYRYFKKRFLRIYPILLMTFLLSTVVFWANGYQFSFTDVKNLVGNLLQFQRMEDEPGFKLPTFLNNYPLWSLAYEWWFYMLFFPLFHLFRKMGGNRKLRGIYTLTAIAVVAWLLFLVLPDHFFLVLNFFLLWWAGYYCAEIYLESGTFSWKDLLPVLGSLFFLSALIGLPVAKALLLDHKSIAQINSQYPLTNYLYHFVEAFLFILIGKIWWQFKLYGFDFLLGAFARLAPISYALYVVHFPIIQLEIPVIDHIYGVLVIKSILIFGVAYLLELKFQPWVISKYKLMEKFF
ncbi:acyltransferase family protein [Pedobacter africanus]|uniref:Peptidoglycan/LPS O-acetylase OafA/YrhL, contains acyltransferase and SGNH-hydrolase domains n=1 Tax=Pedobacter africanus TaxID=151894 RepID=A0A1W2DGA3_9SPHI|nr:acyltransferase [Pedobacter africanus]SMC96006.1 Peptidoglycan/LPS O-acetylase OafA/YrhL, contains acyltransferase and SGNH-hydrolase domains [Pedobacter africanus]